MRGKEFTISLFTVITVVFKRVMEETFPIILVAPTPTAILSPTSNGSIKSTNPIAIHTLPIVGPMAKETPKIIVSKGANIDKVSISRMI